MASGGEQHLTIGNFRNNVTTDTLRRYDYEPLLINPYVTYFYIDHVVLVDTSSDLETPNIFTPNGDNVNDYWTPPFSVETGKVSIVNRWGNLIYEAELNGFKWDGKTNTNFECTNGIYFYRISGTNLAGFIQLVR